MEIKNVTVFGSGLMGAGIVQVAAHAGYNVTMVDVEQDFIDGGMKSVTGDRPLTKRLTKNEILFIVLLIG